MYVHEAQVPYTSPVTRSTSKLRGGGGGDDIICIYDFTLDSLASDTNGRARSCKKCDLSLSVLCHSRPAIYHPHATIYHSRTFGSLDGRAVLLIAAVDDAPALSVHTGRQTSVRTRSITAISRRFVTILQRDNGVRETLSGKLVCDYDLTLGTFNEPYKV